MNYCITPAKNSEFFKITDREAVTLLASQIKQHFDWPQSRNKRRAVEKIVNDSRQLWLTRRIYYLTCTSDVQVSNHKLQKSANKDLRSHLRTYCTFQKYLLTAVQEYMEKPDELEHQVHLLELQFNVSLLP